MTKLLAVRPPEKRPILMTGRARVYLLIAAVRQYALAMCCLWLPETFKSSSYTVIKEAVPAPGSASALFVWGLIFLSAGIMAAAAAWTGDEDIARWALMVAAITGALWAGGFFAALFAGQLTGPTGPIVWGAVVLKDLTMLRQPLRNPFEPLMRKVADEDNEG